jgi:hypothetical protein
MSREWQDFFINLFERVGGNEALTNSELATLLGFITSLSPDRLMATNGDGDIVSVSNLASWVAGTTGKITVSNDGDGTVTITIPNTYLPSGVGGTTGKITVSDDGDGTITITIPTTFLPSGIGGTANQVLVTDNGDGTVTLSTPQNIDTDADVTFDTLILDILYLALDNAKVYFGLGNDFSIFFDGVAANLKTDEVAASDLKLTCGVAKTLELQTAVWEDLNFDPARQGVAAANWPDFVAVGDVIHVEFTSANNQYVGAGNEIPHSYKLSTTLYPHIHIFLKSGESGGTTGVTFTFYWELRTNAGVTTGSVNLTATSAQLTANPNEFAIYDSTGFAGAAIKGAQLRVKLARTGGDAGDVIVLTYGVHFQINTIGSRTLLTK